MGSISPKNRCHHYSTLGVRSQDDKRVPCASWTVPPPKNAEKPEADHALMAEAAAADCSTAFVLTGV